MSANVKLKEYIHPNMDLLFVALNAPENSNNNAHWFTNNLSFWNLLYRTGIITQSITNKLKGDVKVFGDNTINFNNWSIGVTDLNRRDVETDSANVEVKPSDVNRILDIINTNKVAKVCLMHSKVGNAFKDYGSHIIKFNTNRYGKIGHLSRTEIFEVPFHNATVKNKDHYYSLLVNNSDNLSELIKKEKVSSVRENQKPKITSPSIQNNSSSFILPKAGNSITEKDILKGQIRITVDFKKHFPKYSATVNIKYLGKNYNVPYTFNDGKSSILRVGKEFMSLYGIDSRSRVRVILLDDKYVLAKM
jgi:hypothetical protein